jgi:hypothetical protein
MQQQPDPWRWERLPAVATEVGVGKRSLQFWCAGGPGYRPALAHERRGKFYWVQPAEAYEHLLKHGRELRDRIRKPLGYGANSSPTSKPRQQSVSLEQLINNPALIDEMGTEGVRALVGIYSEIRRSKNDLEKRSELLTPDAFVKELHAMGVLFTEHVEDIGATRLANKLVVLMRQQFGVDLESHAGAVTVLEHTIREDCNVSLADFRRAMEDKCRGIRMLEGVNV